MNIFEIKSAWNMTTAKLKQKWARSCLIDEDLQFLDGKEEQEQLGHIQKRTSETREVITIKKITV